MQRKKIKHTTSFQARLADQANRHRQHANELPQGPQRDALLQKAQQADTASHINDWLSLGQRATLSETIDYRAYTVGSDGHFVRFRRFSCDCDNDAIVWAKQLVDGAVIELWNGNRFVARLEPAVHSSSLL